MKLAQNHSDDDQDDDDDDDDAQDRESEDDLRTKIMDILERLPKLFDLVEGQEEDILKLVLDQELQKYNNLLDTMRESLEDSLRGIDGQNLVTPDIEQLLESVQENEIPECWGEAAYPTMEDLEGFLDDLSQRTDFLRSWQQEGPPDTFWLAALFEPGDFLIAILYIHSLETGLPFHELTFESKFDGNPDQDKKSGILARDLYLVGAAWDGEKHLIVDSERDQIFCKMPIVRLVPIHENDDDDNEDQEEKSGGGIYECPLFQNSERAGEDNFIVNLNLPTERDSDTWILAGVALLCQEPKDR